jgi:hypothetical protein
MGAMSVGCARAAVPVPYELTSTDPTQDQRTIAGFYRKEALLLSMKAEAMAQRADTYERLFGHNSEWVVGTRLLVQFYEDAAMDRERLARQHEGLAATRR